jgi:hypothetical protein
MITTVEKDDTTIRIMRIIELIQNTTKIIEVKKSDSEPDYFGIEQYQDRRNQLTHELLDLLNEIGVNLPIAA